jgi:ribosomal protein L16 Arg81 hydroxylase
MNLSWIRYSDLRSAVSNGTPFFIKEAIEEINVTWDDIVSNVNLCNDVNDPIKYLKGTFITHKVLNKKLDQIARPIRAELREVYPGSHGYTSHVYSSMTINAETFGRHKDTADVFFLGIKGTTQFEIWDRNNNVSSYIIEVGDVVFVPRGLYHNTTALTPRSGISFGIERGTIF